jgi:hypothetical protein
MQWRAIGQLCDIPFGTLYTLFARWTRLGLWRRLLNRLIHAWRQACGDTPESSVGHSTISPKQAWNQKRPSHRRHDENI